MHQSCPGRPKRDMGVAERGIERPLSTISPPSLVSKADSHPRFLVFGAPRIEEAEIAEVEAGLFSGWLGTGPRVIQFERDFASWRGVRPSASGGGQCLCGGLHVSMVAAGLELGSEIITNPLTFCARFNAILLSGSRPYWPTLTR